MFMQLVKETMQLENYINKLLILTDDVKDKERNVW